MSNADICLEKAARVFKTLSKPHLLAIYTRLAGVLRQRGSIDTTSDGFSQCRLRQAQELGIAPSTIPHHYKELRDSGLSRMVRQGKSVICHIGTETIQTVRAALGAEAP